MDDLEFVRQFIAGENQAREKFIKQYSRLIFNYINHVLLVKGFKSPSFYAEDIFQEFIVFLMDNNFMKLNAFKARNGASLATWIRHLTINFTRDYLRKVKFTVSLEAETEEGLSLKDKLKDDAAPFTEELMGREKSLALENCIDKLKTEEKYFLELNLNRNISLEIMKDFFRISRGAVDMQKSRIIKKLKECFKRNGFELDL